MYIMSVSSKENRDKSRTFCIILPLFNQMEPRQIHMVDHKTATTCVKTLVPGSQWHPSVFHESSPSSHQDQWEPEQILTTLHPYVRAVSAHTGFVYMERFMATALDQAQRRKNEYQR